MTNGIQQLADNLAEFGRYGDTYMVHAAEGETVVPAEILEANPNLKDELFRQMQLMGIQDPNRYVVGNTLNSINPITGQPEFFFKKLFKKIVKVAKVAAPIVVGAFNPAAGAALGAGIAAAEGRGIRGILGGASSGYFGGSALRGGLGGAGGLAGFRSSLSSPANFARFLGQTGKGAAQGLIFGDPIQGGGAQGILTALGGPQIPSFAGLQQNPALGPGFVPQKPFVGPPRPFVGPPAPKGLAQSVGAQKTTGGLSSVASKALKFGLPIAGAIAAFKDAEKFRDKEDDEELSQLRAAQNFFSTPLKDRTSPEAIANRRLAGIMPAFNASEIARITGIRPEDAESYLRSAYPGEVLAAMGGEIVGPGTGTSDSIPARLSDGEFVLTAQAVRGAGNGNRDLGAARMYDLMSRFERMA